MLRTCFLVDGFNLYHSLREGSRDMGLRKMGTRWLNLNSFLSSYLANIGSALGARTELENIYYFSALATHLDASNPAETARHSAYIECLKDTGVKVELGRFKPKHVHCKSCGQTTIHHEEKETDVAISVRLVELGLSNLCEVAVIVSGDTDIAPAVRMAQRLAPQLKIVFAFPYRRKNRELVSLAAFNFDLTPRSYHNHQFSDPVMLADGRSIAKPSGW